MFIEHLLCAQHGWMHWKFSVKHNRVLEELVSSGDEEKAQINVYQMVIKKR